MKTIIRRLLATLLLAVFTLVTTASAMAQNIVFEEVLQHDAAEEQVWFESRGMDDTAFIASDQTDELVWTGPLGLEPEIGYDSAKQADELVWTGPLGLEPEIGYDASKQADELVWTGPLGLEPEIGCDAAKRADELIWTGPLSLEPELGYDTAGALYLTGELMIINAAAPAGELVWIGPPGLEPGLEYDAYRPPNLTDKLIILDYLTQRYAGAGLGIATRDNIISAVEQAAMDYPEYEADILSAVQMLARATDFVSIVQRYAGVHPVGATDGQILSAVYAAVAAMPGLGQVIIGAALTARHDLAAAITEAAVRAAPQYAAEITAAAVAAVPDQAAVVIGAAITIVPDMADDLLRLAS